MLPKRKIIRLQDFDYGSVNAYFITICVKDFRCVFGEVRQGVMGLSELGNIAAVYLQSISQIYAHVLLDEWIVMPNHVHAIIEITAPTQSPSGANHTISISHIINQYKGSVKKWSSKNDFLDFEWQTRFYDHVIRDQKAYHTIADYIHHNPQRWQEDRYHL